MQFLLVAEFGETFFVGTGCGVDAHLRLPLTEGLL
jgi:hypothetical protein